MKVKLFRWGNGLAARIPAQVTEEAERQDEASFDVVAIPKGGVRLTPLRASPKIEELVAKITEGKRHNETDWGEPVGNEAWYDRESCLDWGNFGWLTMSPQLGREQADRRLVICLSLHSFNRAPTLTKNACPRHSGRHRQRANG